jgi:hypothetical protein
MIGGSPGPGKPRRRRNLLILMHLRLPLVSFLAAILVGAAAAQTSWRTAALDGSQEVPPNASTRRGYAIVRLVEPPTR